MKKMLTLICSMAIVAITGFNCLAADTAAVCGPNQIKIATGVPNATYSQLVQAMRTVRPDLVCENRDTTGGLYNLQLLLQRKTDAGFMQVDVIDYMQGTDPMISKKIKSLMSFHGNSLHVFVKKGGTATLVDAGYFGMGAKTDNVTIRSLRDLQGRKAAIFASALITGSAINEGLRLGINFVEVNKPDVGFAMLDKGEVYAFIALGGWPIDWATKLDTKLYGLARVEPADVQALGKSYYYPGKISYQNLGALGVPTLMVRNELFVWDYNDGPRVQQLLNLRNWLFEQIPVFANTPESLPAWNDMENPQNTYWKRYNPIVKKK